MKTITDKKVSLPKMKDCRIDYKYTNGGAFTVLIDFVNDNALYCEAGSNQLKYMYSEFKFSALNELPIQTSILNILGCNFQPLENVLYSLY